MPELPDVTVYLERLDALVTGHPLEAIRLGSPFLLRTVAPPLSAFEGLVVRGFSRLGKRIVFHFDGDLYLVFHLMIAGRLRWRPRGAKLPKRRGLAALDFDHATVLLTEEGTQKRARLHAVEGAAALAEHDPGGLELLDPRTDVAAFAARLTAANHTLKRALTDPRIFSGIGNAYSDEILHRARLSPIKLTSRLDEDEIARLLAAIRATLTDWTERLRADVEGGFPEKVTAFRGDMAVHGRFRQPCPVCGAPVQRIRYAKNVVNYCPGCQTEGRILADRSLSRLLKKDWPRTLAELEESALGRTRPTGGGGRTDR